MRIRSASIFQVNLLFAINLAAFVVLLNVLLFSLRNDLSGLKHELSALSTEVTNYSLSENGLTSNDQPLAKTDYATLTNGLQLMSLLPAQPANLILLPIYFLR